MKINQNKDFAKEMRNDLRNYYIKMRPLIQESISETLPKLSAASWLESVSGKSRYEWDGSAISQALLSPVNTYVERRSNLLRPLLEIIVLEAFGKDPLKFKPAIAISELLYVSSLIIEDYFIGTSVQSSGPTTNRASNSSIWGNAAIWLSSYTVNILYNNVLNLSKETLLRIYKYITKEYVVAGIGKGVELIWQRERRWCISEDEYLQHVIDKKRSINFQGPLIIPALIADAHEEKVENLGAFGELLGLACYLYCEVLSLLFPNEESFHFSRKQVNNSWRRFLIIHTLAQANVADKKNLLEILNSQGAENTLIHKAVEIVKKYKAVEYTEKKAQKFLKEAFNYLEKAQIPHKFEKLLKSFAQYCVDHQLEI